MIDWVRNTSVLGNALVCEIDLAVCIYSYVLKKSISSDCVVDIWLRILIQVDNLSIASTFEVENAVVIPAVLIITDQETLRICRKCSLFLFQTDRTVKLLVFSSNNLLSCVWCSSMLCVPKICGRTCLLYDRDGSN